MREMKIYRLSVLLAFITILYSCDQTKTSTADEENIVNVSILPLKYFTEQLAGDFVKVNVMIPQGANPSTYEPTPRQISLLSRSDAYLGIEPLIFEKTWMQRFKASGKDMKYYDLSRDIKLISNKHGNHSHGAADPHIWISPKTVKILVKNMRDAFIELYPEHQETIKENYGAVQKLINQKDQFWQKTFKEKENISFLIFHPALGYLARDYGLDQLIIQHEGKEPSPKDLRRITQKAKEKNVNRIFVQQQFDVRNAKTIANELDMEVTVINPLSEDWPGEIEKIGKALAD